jgi:CubicO group peptidase (beta-lactamase class C family)
VGDRQVVPAQWMKDIITPSPTNPNYGYFTWIGTTYTKVRPYNSKATATAFHSEPFAAPDVIYFDGFGGQRVYIVPSKQLVIVHTGPLRQDWDDAILPNMIIRALP